MDYQYKNPKKKSKKNKNKKLEIDPSFPEFKKSEKKYKLYQDYETDFSELLDFSNNSNSKIELNPLIKKLESKDYLIYKFLEPEGVYLIKNFIKIEDQINLTLKCLNEYNKQPYRTNLFIYEGKNEENIDSNYDLDKYLVSNYSKYYFNKKIRWSNVGYQYDWNNRTYPSEKTDLPIDLYNLSEITKAFIKDEIKEINEYKAQSTIINYYDKKNYMGGHLDDGEQDQKSPIFSYSFGLSCVFLIGGKTKEIKPWAIKLDSGDLLIMSGYSRTCYHGVPRIIDNSFDFKKFDDFLKIKFKNEEIDYERKEKIEGEFLNDEIHAINYLRDNRLNLNFRQVFI